MCMVLGGGSFSVLLRVIVCAEPWMANAPRKLPNMIIVHRMGIVEGHSWVGWSFPTISPPLCWTALLYRNRGR